MDPISTSKLFALLGLYAVAPAAIIAEISGGDAVKELITATPIGVAMIVVVYLFLRGNREQQKDAREHMQSRDAMMTKIYDSLAEAIRDNTKATRDLAIMVERNIERVRT